MSKKFKALLSAALILSMMFSCMLAVNAGTVKFTVDDAKEIAVEAAKAEMEVQGVPQNYIDACNATLVKYNKTSGVYSVTVRSTFTYCYTCKVSVTDVIGIEYGSVYDGAYSQKNMAEGYFMNLFEVLENYIYWVIMDLPDNLKSLLPTD